MRPPKHLTIVAGLIALAMLAAGCGGGDDGGETTAAKEATEAAPSLSKQELISQGDAICAEVNAAVASVGTSTADTQTQITQVADLYIGMVESLKNLGEPQETAGYSEFIEAAEELAAIEDEIKLAAEREEPEVIGEAATRAAPALEEFQSEAELYGFEECGQTPTAPTGPGSGVGGEGGEVEEGGAEAAPEVEEEIVPEEVAPEEVAPEEAAPETGGAGAGAEEAPEGGGTAPGSEESGGSQSGGVGPG